MIDITYFANKVKAEESTAPARHPVVPDPLTFRGVVYPWHLDHMDHMNVQHYSAVFDQSSWVLLSMLGLDSEYFRKNERGMAALEQTITYKSELRAGDIFEIRSSVLDVGEKTMRIVHNMRQVKTNTLAASTTILGIHLDTRARKSLALPHEARERARVLTGGK